MSMRKPCATSGIEEKVNVRIDFLTRQDKQPEKLVESVETFD